MSTQKAGCNSEHRLADSVPSISVKQDVNANSALTIPAVLENSKIEEENVGQQVIMGGIADSMGK